MNLTIIGVTRVETLGLGVWIWHDMTVWDRRQWQMGKELSQLLYVFLENETSWPGGLYPSFYLECQEVLTVFLEPGSQAFSNLSASAFRVWALADKINPLAKL